MNEPLETLYPNGRPEGFDGLQDKPRTVSRERKDPMQLKSTISSLLIGCALWLGSNYMVSHFEGDPLREMYDKNPDVYGPDMAALYDKRNEYCRPAWLRKMVAGFDAGTCMQKEKALEDYGAKVAFALQVEPHTARNIHSDSYDVLAVVNEQGNEFRDQVKNKQEGRK